LIEEGGPLLFPSLSETCRYFLVLGFENMEDALLLPRSFVFNKLLTTKANLLEISTEYGRPGEEGEMWVRRWVGAGGMKCGVAEGRRKRRNYRKSYLRTLLFLPFSSSFSKLHILFLGLFSG
jgi:hypothetical protein